jgi:4-amino-4-deoxy-L-arabinose transferase-like glycosyltransferase
LDDSRRVSMVMGLLALGLYGLTLPTIGFNSDVYAYIVTIREGQPRALFHVHHLLHGPTGYLWTRLLAWTGLPFDTLLRTLSAVFGAAAVAGFALIVGRYVSSRTRQVLATAAFASCFAVWIFSVDVEVYIPSTAFLCFSYVVLARAGEEGSVRRAAAAGLLMGAGALYHQMGALFALVGIVLLAAGPGTRPTKVRLVAAFWLSGLLLVLPVYVWAGVAVHGVRSPRQFVVWLLGYSLRGYGVGFRLENLVEAALGHGRSLVYFDFVLKDLQKQTAYVALELALVALAALALVGGTLGSLLGWRREAAARRAAPLAALVTWYLVYGFFSFWWEPDNVKFWVTAMVPFWALWAGGLALAGGRWQAVTGTLVAILLGCNFYDLHRRRDPAYDPEVTAVRTLAARLQPGDAVLLPPTLDARAGAFAPQLGRIRVYLICKDAKEADRALGELESQIAGARRAGGRVYFYERAFSLEVLRPHPWCREAETAFRERHFLEPAFALDLPVDDDESGGPRRLARWRQVPVFEVLDRR